MSGFSDFTQWASGSLAIKLITIGILVLVLLIPNAFVSSLINERSGLQYQADQQVAGTWGLRQTLRGPLVLVPFTIPVTKEQPAIEGVAHFLPDVLNIDGNSAEQVKKRGIYKSILYQAKFKLEGSLTAAPDADMGNKILHWNRARLAMGISDLTGISDALKMTFGGQVLDFQPGVSSPTVVGSGVSAALSDFKPNEKYDFTFELDLKGSSYIGFEPVGKTTNITLKSNWPSPNFTGRFATDTNSISDKGFKAQWQVLDLNRNYPQQWTNDAYTFKDTEVGVELMQTVNDYSRNQRTAKYAILVIGLTFLIYFFFELLQQMRINPLHYLLVGLALSLFYVLLLSFSEHIGFNTAYGAASAATIALITLYTGSITRSRRFAIQLGGLLVIIFGFIYTVLQMEDFALLVGSLGLFAALATVMYLTRNVLLSTSTSKE